MSTRALYSSAGPSSPGRHKAQRLACITWFITEGEGPGAPCAASDGTGTGCVEKVKHRHAVAFWRKRDAV
ncbi:hypothetical protein EYF80_050587 [Liparis tanakae]|uniref:Uncharacterized protein n=1 Tax=Liparis tanakae TaxID=230148 RepID=A0A4Z2FEP9_9TELE|nr:hypothetical protein EYF80_050587 [Liparis tanakae]